MLNFLLTTATALTLLTAPAPSAPTMLPTENNLQMMTAVDITSDTVIWTVKPEDTLQSIALSYYGTEEFWTTVWNDNPWIIDPYTIEVNWVLKLRESKPEQVEELSPVLAEKIAEPIIDIPVVDPVITQAVVPTAQPVVAQPITTSAGPLNSEQIQYLGNCEAGMNPARNSGNGYYGAFQFSEATWNSMGTGYARADLAPIEVQIDAVQRLLSRSSIYTQFPGCARKMQNLGII